MFLPSFRIPAMRSSSASDGRISGSALCTVKGGSAGAVALEMSTGTISTATPRSASAAWQAIATLRRA
jgi:hypothetical protein